MRVMSTSRLLLLLNYVIIQLVAVLRDRILVVVIDGDANDAVAHGLIGRVMELRHEDVGECLVSCDSLVRVELEQLPKKVLGISRRIRVHVRQRAWVGRRQALEHGCRKW